MRQIKFEVMLKGKHFGYEQINEFGQWEWTCTGLNPVNKINWTQGVMVSGSEFIRRQFTGLLDKNGKEIYEADILRLPPQSDWDKENYSCHEVFFHDGDANTDYNIGYTMNRMHNHGAVCGGIIPQFKPKQTAKMIIIGNIYENPELLK